MRKIGIEHEFFVFSKDGRPASWDQNFLVFQELKNIGYSSFNKNAPLIVSKELDDGYVAISNDFCTHIMEIALPPFSNLKNAYSALKSVCEDVYLAVEKAGMVIRNGASVELENKEITFIDNGKLNWFKSREVPNFKYSERYPTTKITSTQFDIDIKNVSQFWKNIKTSYALEYLLAFLFQPEGGVKENVRPLIWRDSFSASYKFFGFNNTCPEDIKSYEEGKTEIVGFLRDYSFVAPRNKKRIEFRGSCCQPSIERIIDLANLRILLVDMLERVEVKKSLLVSSENFYAFFESGRVDKRVLSEITRCMFDLVEDQTSRKTIESVISKNVVGW